jgi:hypothetical protein
MFAAGAILLLAPPAALIAALGGTGGSTLLAWAATTTSMMVALWMLIAVGVEAPWWVGPLYPLGSLVGLYILLKSWLGKGRVRWKGRSYAWDVYSDVHGDEAAPAAEPAASQPGRVA